MAAAAGHPFSLASFEGCRVWIEKDMPNDDTLTYARLAVAEEPSAPENSALPATGDDAAPALGLALMLAALTGLSVLLRTFRLQKER